MPAADALAASCRRLAIIGTAKNVGKTVALRAIVAGLGDRGEVVGVTSVGRDGEARDVLDPSIVKPRIELAPGALVATALPLLRRCASRVELVETTPFRTPLGVVAIGRMLDAGEVEVAGPGSAAATAVVSDMMFSLGADRVIIDGSLDRRAAANPSVSDGVVLATGAVLDRDPTEVVRRTAVAAALLRLPRLPDGELRRAADRASSHLAIGPDGTWPLPRGVVLRGGTERDAELDPLLARATHLIVRGALCEDFVARVAAARADDPPAPLTIVADDAAKVFLDATSAARCAARGIAVAVLDPITLVAVTVNPVAPGSHRFDSATLCAEMARAIPEVAVLDVVAGTAAGRQPGDGALVGARQ
ncbi:hypothetical protein DSM104299_05506 [Baekduia alba]|uniref:lysine 5,6-aminomutase reactivase subunit KamB n=1 Tax=Baekduia alba TaxID=2997333 RepID=UPI00234234AF|nr:hypothetical protein [Baekduia alba]WCB96740.1 hypothetical protein DSM104299_05506 [Baekduia alba]